MTAVNDIGATIASSTHDASVQFLFDLKRIAALSEALTVPPGITPATLKQYVGARADAIETRKNTLVSSLASLLATNKDLDQSDISKLQALADCSHPYDWPRMSKPG